MLESLQIRLFMVLVLILSVFIYSLPVYAFGSSPVLSHIKTGETGFTTHEFISVYNNRDTPVDVSGWCLVYSSSTDVTKTNLVCLNAPSDSKLMLAPYSYARFSTAEFNSSIPGFASDFSFSAGLSGTSGHVRLFDAMKNEVDKIGWGTALSPEQANLPAHKSGFVYQRKSVSGTLFLQDTDNNLADFSESILSTIPASGLYEELIDVCFNIDGAQPTVPSGYVSGASANCDQDFCLNIDGLQPAIPDGYESLDGSDCTLKVVLESAILEITELLPNAVSTDTGKEFIELYNPNDIPVNLAGYTLEVGPTYSKFYTLGDAIIGPSSYFSISDSISQLVLPNSTGSVRLRAPNGTIVSETDAYIGPQDDEAWALIDDTWQYTDTLTPGSANVGSVVNIAVYSSDGLEPCAAGKYRNPETNRCKTIETGDSELNACDVGQTRNPDTNRCRSLSTLASLASCKAGQERNPATNRCRAVVSTASSLVACDTGQERNPETNRCKKSAVLGDSTSKVQDLPASTKNSLNYWLLGGLLVGAVGYGVYEWRHEILNGFLRLRFKA